MISVRITVIRRVIIFDTLPKQRCSNLLSLSFLKISTEKDFSFFYYYYLSCFALCLFFTGPLQRKWTRSTSQANQHRASDRLKDPNFPCHPFVISCKKTERKKYMPATAARQEKHTAKEAMQMCTGTPPYPTTWKNTYTPHIIVHKIFLQKGRMDIKVI